MVTGAIVSITDDLGNSTSLIEVSEGIYKSDTLTLRGTAGREYTLRIRTETGKSMNLIPASLMKPVILTLFTLDRRAKPWITGKSSRASGFILI